MKLRKIAMCVALSLIFSFIVVGYASLSDTMITRGHAEVDTPEGLFITGISEDKYSGLDVREASFTEYSTTVSTDLSKSSDRTAGSVTYTIEVYNNTKHVYAYRGLYYQTSALDNTYIAQDKNKNPTKKQGLH